MPEDPQDVLRQQPHGATTATPAPAEASPLDTDTVLATPGPAETPPAGATAASDVPTVVAGNRDNVAESEVQQGSARDAPVVFGCTDVEYAEGGDVQESMEECPICQVCGHEGGGGGGGR